MKEKRMDFELMRLLAIVLVVFNHSQGWGFELYQAPGVSQVNLNLSLLLGIVCKIAVPLFLLVSGGLLLDREEPISVVLRKRVLRIAAVLVVFSAILYLFWWRWGYVQPSPKDFLRRLFSEGISAPYWYLYLYLGLMLLLPLLRPMARALEDRHFLYLAALHLLLYGVAYSLGAAFGIGPPNGSLRLYLAEPYLFYFLMGYYLACRMDWQRFDRRKLGISWLLAAAAVAVMFALARLGLSRDGEIPINYHTSLIALPVFAVYASLHRLCEMHPPGPGLRRVLSELGGCVFGAYLLEGILRHYLGPLYEALQPHIHVLPACMIWVLAVTACGLGLTWLMRRIPAVRKLL